MFESYFTQSDGPVAAKDILGLITRAVYHDENGEALAFVGHLLDAYVAVKGNLKEKDFFPTAGEAERAFLEAFYKHSGYDPESCVGEWPEALPYVANLPRTVVEKLARLLGQKAASERRAFFKYVEENHPNP